LTGDIDRLRDLPEVALQDRHVRGLAGDIRPAPHGDANVGARQRR